MQFSENLQEITFRLATSEDRAIIKQWWTKPHVIEFWDNSPGMWENIENYFLGKKDLFDYWIVFFGQSPFSLIMTSEIDKNIPSTHVYFPWIELEKLNMTIDFMIGEENFLGKGFSYQTLKTFFLFLKTSGVSSFLIDPAINNIKAINAYKHAGFEIVDTFIPEEGYFSGIKHYLMKLKL